MILRVLIQRVLSASVRLIKEGKVKEEASISKGLLLFVGIGKNDSLDTADFLANKIFNLRIFENKGKFDLSLADIKGEILAVPQFTLYGNTEKGRRPEFTGAERPDRAEVLFDFFCDRVEPNTRTLAAWVEGTSTTYSPAATSCWASR